MLAGAGAAATSTLIGGRLGVAGTVVGAAIASIVTTMALNLYDNTLKRVSHQLKTKVAGRRRAGGAAGPGQDTASDLTQDTAVLEAASGSSPAEPWRRRPLTRKVIRWSLVTALVSTLLGLGLMVGLERGTATQITPGTSQLAGTSERSDAGADRGTGTDGSGSGTSTIDESEITTDTEVDAPSIAPSAEETIVPTEVPTPGASVGTGSDTTTSDGSTGTDGGTTSGTTTDGTTSGGTTTDGGTTGGTSSGSTGSGTSGTTGGTGTTP